MSQNDSHDTALCKFRCDAVDDTSDGSIIHLSAVVNGSVENERFFKYTPYGTLHFGVIDQTMAHAFFAPGEEYYLTIQKA